MLKAVPHLPAFSVPALRRGFLSAVLLVAAVGWLRGADSRPVVGPGATKEEVITAYGWPNGQSQLGSKEILNYPQGSVTLENGLVERVDFSTKVPWPAPRPRPGTEVPPAKTAAPQPPKNTTESGFDPWTTSLPLAMAQADKQGALILAVFTGSDWSPPSRRFINEVATHPDFVNPLRGDFVFLKLDFPTRVALPAELRTQNEELRARSGVTTYPALVVLSKAGEPMVAVDLSKEPAGANYRDSILVAVTEVRDLLRAKPLKPPVPAPSASAPPVSKPPPPPGAVDAAMSSAAWNLMRGLAAGAVIAGVILWWLWRKPKPKDPTAAPARQLLTGLSRGSLPTVAELNTWPAERVQLLVTGLFEAGGYVAKSRAGQPNELDLTRPDDPAVRVIACCWAGANGLAHAKAIRELSGSLVAEDVANGWFVAIAGFSKEARVIAQERGIALIDAENLLARLRQLPKMALLRAFNRAGA